jgi:hypothetical protein
MRGSAAFRAAVAPGGVLAGPWVRNELWRRARAVPSLDLRFAENKSLQDAASGQQLVTFTRASSATYVDSAGVIRTATTDEPRFDHNPTTGESLGLLVEEQRTNSILQSQDFSTTWTNTGSSENINVAVAPDGTQTADALVDTAVSEAHNFSQSVAGLSGSTSYTFSCYMKKGSKDFGALIFSPNASWGTGSGASVFFNLSTGTVNTTSSATASIQALPDGWYRCTATATTVASPGTVSMRIGSSLTGSVQTYTGSADEAIYLWGAQLEAGAFPTSYIPTTTATVTRSADVASISGSNFSSWFNAAATTLYAEYATANNIFTAFPSIASLSNGTNGNRIQLSHSSGARRFVVDSGGVSQVDSGGALGAISANVSAKFAAAVQNADFSAIATGATLFTQSSGSMPSGVDRLVIGADGASASLLSGAIRRITYWPQRLPNSTLQAITQ